MSISTDLFKPANVLDFIQPFDKIPAGENVVFVARVSDEEQRDHLDHQISGLYGISTGKDWNIVGAHGEVSSGRFPWLYPAVMLARKYKAVLLAESPCRLKRSILFDYDKNRSAPLLLWDMLNLVRTTNGIQLYTVANPLDPAHCGSTKSEQIKRGHRIYGNGGRPIECRKKYKEAWFPVAGEMRRLRNTYREIADKITHLSRRSISHFAIYKWLNDL